ncbi:hypothetical protein QFZ33_004522 [Arthrobacter globiformis]|nr:hypothetical protein [Arthrobacter globiformis]
MTTAAVESMTVSFPLRRVRPLPAALVALNIWSVYFGNVKQVAYFNKIHFYAKCI